MLTQMRRIGHNIFVLLVLILGIACTFKPKTELYLERGLDILSNKKQVDFILLDNIEIEQIGIVRDKKEQKKVIVFMMNFNTDSMSFRGLRVGLRAKIKGDDSGMRTERWDFEPRIIERKGFKYLTKDIKLKEDKIQRLSVFLYRDKDPVEQSVGEILTLKNLLTYND